MFEGIVYTDMDTMCLDEELSCKQKAWCSADTAIVHNLSTMCISGETSEGRGRNTRAMESIVWCSIDTASSQSLRHVHIMIIIN